jgi:hypothetical protein
MESKRYVSVELDGTVYKLKTALVGGLLHDDPSYPMAFYAGKLALEEIGMSLLHALRAVIKIQVDVHEFTLEESEEFVLFCLAEAMSREERRLKMGSDDSDTVLRMTKHNL